MMGRTTLFALTILGAGAGCQAGANVECGITVDGDRDTLAEEADADQLLAALDEVAGAWSGTLTCNGSTMELGILFEVDETSTWALERPLAGDDGACAPELSLMADVQLTVGENPLPDEAEIVVFLDGDTTVVQVFPELLSIASEDGSSAGLDFQFEVTAERTDVVWLSPSGCAAVMLRAD